MRPCRADAAPTAVFMILVTLIISQLLVNIWMFYAKVSARRAFARSS